MFIVRVKNGENKGKFVAKKKNNKGTWLLTNNKQDARIFTNKGMIKNSFIGNYKTKMWKKYYGNFKLYNEAIINLPNLEDSYEIIEISITMNYEK